MHRFVNGYLIVFLLDAILSVLDDQLELAGLASPVSPLRSAVAGIAVLYALPAFWSLAFRPDIPKSVILPLTTVVFWFALGGLPMPLYLGIMGGVASLSVIQLVVSLLVFWRVRVVTHGRWFFDATTLPARPPRLGSAIVFACVTLVVVPILVVGYFASMIPLAVASSTDGFLQIGRDGIHTQTRVYRKDDRMIYLVGMIHVGDPEFYHAIFNGLAGEGATVLFEGVTDEQGLLRNAISYKWVASILNLEAQGESGESGRAPSYRSVWADVDVSELLPETRAFLNRLGVVLANETREDFLRALVAELTTEQPPLQELRLIMFDINERRSAHAIEVLERELTGSRVIVMAWGALHMPAFVEAVESRGFDLVDTIDRRAIAF